MNIAVYSITRDRLEYSKKCFESLQTLAGVEYDHFILDNGSKDGTPEWLQQYKEKADDDGRRVNITLLPENIGISRASNKLLDLIRCTSAVMAMADVPSYELICKVDNDCLVQSENILGQISEIYEDCNYHAKYILSPKVNGIVNQPSRGRYTSLGGRRIGLTAIVGGLFHCVPSPVYANYKYPENLPLAKGQDDHFCNWAKQRGCEVGYIEGLEVEHYEGTDAQARRFPEYFKRKAEEEKLILA